MPQNESNKRVNKIAATYHEHRFIFFHLQLKVSETKFVLKHKAEVEGVVPVIKTKLSLEAVVGK